MKVAKQKSQDLARLAALVRQMKIGMLTTIEADGSLRSRPRRGRRPPGQPELRRSARRGLRVDLRHRSRGKRTSRSGR